MRSETPYTVITRGIPPTSSYWVGCDRAELRQRIDARRAQMAVGPDAFNTRTIAWDNSVAAELSLRTRLAEQRVRRAAQQRAVAR